MGKKKKENRVGSVAYNRAHGLNKAAGGPGKSPSPSPSPRPSPSPSPSPRPTPSPSPRPTPSPSPRPTPSPSPSSSSRSGGGGSTGYDKRVNRVGSVAYNRAQAKAAAQSMKQYKSENNITRNEDRQVKGSTNFTNAQLAGNATAGAGKVRARRAAAQNAGLSVNDYKNQLAAGTINKHGSSSNEGLAKGNLGGTYGIRGRPATDSERQMNEANGAVMRDSGWAKTDHDLDYTLEDMINGHYAYMNPNNDLYELGKERQSSEGLYQDRYNVGYHSEDDKGDPYASNSFMGSTKGYFDEWMKGDTSFIHAYKNYVGHGRDEGYAGDVLKMIDTGKIKNVSDDMYNMIVTDAKNYDWKKRGEIAGRDAGQASYDSRIGGMSQSSITANKNWQANQDAGYYQAGAMDPAEAAAMYGNDATGSQATAQDYQRQQEVDTLGNPGSNNPNLNAGGSNAYNNWLDTRQFGGQVPSYQNNYNPSNYSFDNRSQKSGQKGLNIDFSFNPNRFSQGQ